MGFGIKRCNDRLIFVDDQIIRLVFIVSGLIYKCGCCQTFGLDAVMDSKKCYFVVFPSF